MTLLDAPLGVTLRLGRPGTTPDRARRLAALGLRPGAAVRVVRRAVGGARVVGVGDARVALAADVAALLPVRPDLPEPDDA